ncbi:MAG: replication-associated recombination protein A [Clostridia bacterium]
MYNAPLADKIRPITLDDVVGQQHILGKGKALRRIIESNEIPNLIFYGPSGVGKTTVASIIAKNTNKYLVKLNGTNASTADIKDLIKETNGFLGTNGILLYLDEIQYFTKKQQQTLLEVIENGKITLIASTTENPYFYVYNAILSRSTVFEFKPINSFDIEKAVVRAFETLSENKPYPIEYEPEVVKHIAMSCGGDVRKAMNSTELCMLTADQTDVGYKVTLEMAKQLSQKSAMRYDKDGEEHYDIISAFQKSMRGSDPDASLHYLARLIEAGDIAIICRRLLICACEDVGLAYPQIIPIVKACVDSALMVGFPEARIPLADAVIIVATAPKSNSGECAIDRALADVKAGKTGSVPRSLQNVHFDGDDVNNKGQNYLYPHDYQNSWVKQQYLPDNLVGSKYYISGNNKTEQNFQRYWNEIKKGEIK